MIACNPRSAASQAALNHFASQTPAETFWVKIENQKTFTITPGTCSSGQNHAYRLTYYAMPNTSGAATVNNTLTITEQIDSQIKLIKEQMQTTSEEVLKRRQEELGERNKEQVSKIIDPLQQSLKNMQEAFDKSKEQQNEALTRLDETIKINMQKSAELGETADRLTRALTGEVKVQGNFGELKLKQLLEDLELKEGEQFDTQETLRDKAGKTAKGEDGKGLIPDFILHFPNNRHVVVDSKMSLTE